MNLAAQSHVGVSFKLPNYTTQVNAIGTLNILDSIKKLKLKKIKFYQASTSELFGQIQEKDNQKKQNFTLKVLMHLLSYLLIGLQKIIESLIICLHLMVYYLIMSHQEEEKHLSLEKLQLE